MEAKNGDHSSPSIFLANEPRRYVSSDQSPDAEIPGTPDRVKVENDTTSYTSSSHWTSILDGIAELRDQLEQIPTEPQPRNPGLVEMPGPDILFGRQRHATQREILSGMPTRTEADTLVDAYFSTMHMSPTILHKPTFLREYAQFWEHPFETPIMWLGLLFSIFSLATRFQNILSEYEDVDLNPARTSMVLARIDFYREKLVQCLVLANYFKCPPYTIETFLQYFITEYFRSQDSQFGTWMVVGMTVRMAFRMGYHRDPSRFSNIPPFKAEMRRRIWAMVVQLDLMSSSQIGLPRMIQPSMHDVMEPRNLTDEDLSEDMTELPPSRPDTEATVMLYALIRTRVLTVFARIMDLTNLAKQPAYRDIMELDSALRTVFDDIPPSYKAIRIKDFQASDSDDGERRNRLYLGLNFLKAEMMLHRPYLLLGRTDPRYEYSRLACLDAALEILAFQKVLDRDSRPGGKLWSAKWRLWSVSWRLSSLVAHDFLLATTVLCLDLDTDLISPMPVSEKDTTNRIRFKSGQPTRAEIIDALTSSYAIWIRACEKSREAQKVVAAVSLVLGKANANAPIPTTYSAPPNQEDFASFVPQYNHDSMPASSAFMGIDNTQFTLPFLENDVSMDFGDSFAWAGLESNFVLPNFEQNPPLFSGLN